MGNIEKLARAGLKEKSRLAKKGRAAIATVVAMKKQIQKSFYAMGKALVVLRDPAVIRALGHPSFEALCEVDLKMSDAQAVRLIHIVESFPKGIADDLGSTKATAVIDLANALGKKATASGLVKRGTVHLPNGKSIDVKAASAANIARAARAVHKPNVHGPGMHVSPEDRRLVAHVAAALRKAKVRATVEALAASGKDGARMRLTVNARDAPRVGRALAAVKS
jgi:hypothetical protein